MRLAPCPRNRSGVLVSLHRRITAASSSKVRGSTKYSAAPPSLNQVYGASETSRRTFSPASMTAGPTDGVLIKSSNKLIGDLPDVARAHGEDDVPGAGMSEDMLDDFVEPGKVEPVGTVGPHAFNELGAVDGRSVSGAVADKVDVGDEEVVGMSKALGKVVKQKSGSRMLVRLKHHPKPPAGISSPNGAKRNLHFGRMMPVIIKEQNPPRLRSNAQPPIRPRK